MIRGFLSFTLAAVAACASQAPGSPTRAGVARVGVEAPGSPAPAGSAHGGTDAAPQQPAQQQPAPQPPATTQPPGTTAPPSAPKPPGAPQASSDAAAVPATDPVITIQGICASTPARKTGAAAGAKTPASAPAGASCKTLVTKTQFEDLLSAVNPSNQNIAPAMRRNLAQAYVELLTFTQAAQKAGVDKDPKFAEVLRLVRMRTLEDFYRRSLEEKYRTPPASEVQAYYNQNLPKYEEIKLSRIFIPAKNPAAPSKDDWEKKAAQLAGDVRDRAAKGEDFEKLQKEAYTTLGLTITPPSTTVGNRRRGMLAPQEEQELFGLKAGEVSKLEQEPAGYIIYKVESKQTVPEDQVKDEISRELFRQKMDSQLKSVTGSVHADFNDKYFGPPNPPQAMGAPGSPPGAPGAARMPKGPPKPEPALAAPPASTPPPSQGQAPPK